MEGNIKWFNRNKGYGFITGDDNQEYFVHQSQTNKELRENDRVSFDAVKTDKGRQAQDVKLLPR